MDEEEYDRVLGSAEFVRRPTLLVDVDELKISPALGA